MSLTIEQTDAAIRETFYNMEEGTEYVLNDFWFQEINRVRKVYGYSPLNDKKEYKFIRKGDHLFFNGGFIFDFTGNNNLALALAFGFGLAFSFIFTFTFSLAFSLQHNGIEKLKLDTCEGKVVEIDGKKYKLTAV